MASHRPTLRQVPIHMSPQASSFQPTPLLSPADIKSQLTSSFKHGLTQNRLLAHVLHRPIPHFTATPAEAALRSAIVVCLDAEWYEYSPSHITELGISILLPESVDAVNGEWDSAWKVMRQLLNFHVRIKPNAHLVNSELCEGHPEAFQFGRTSFVNVVQARDLLRYAFARTDAAGNPRPIIFIGHAVSNDIETLATHFGFEIGALGNVVTTLDTQVMARELSLAEAGRKMRLSNLLWTFGITEKYLHNAGNDTVTTMIAAMLMAYGIGGDYSYLYANYKKFTQVRGGHRGRVIGDYVWCTRCEDSKHFASACRERVCCSYCAKRANNDIKMWKKQVGLQDDAAERLKEAEERLAEAKTHAKRKCKEIVKDAARYSPSSPALQPQFVLASPYVASVTLVAVLPRVPFVGHAVPCALCIESTDPSRFKEEYAYMHREEECLFREEGKEEGKKEE
jgi:hypothetical protein